MKKTSIFLILLVLGGIFGGLSLASAHYAEEQITQAIDALGEVRYDEETRGLLEAADAALAAASSVERDVHWRRCQEIVREDCPWIFTHYNKSNMLVRRRVGNFVPGVFSYGAESHFTVEGEAGK